MNTTINSHIRPFDIRRDLDRMGDLVEVAFSDDLANRGSDVRAQVRSIKRMAPLALILSRVFADFRHMLDGFVWEEDSARIVASVLVQPVDNDQSRWHIYTIATHPDYRRRGLARQLTVRAMEHARTHGAEICTLEVRADNAPAYALYRSLGFTHYDSDVGLKLEQLPPVQYRPPDGYAVRPLPSAEWQPRYEIAKRATPAEVQAFLPVSVAQYRASGLQRTFFPLLIRLQGMDRYCWSAEREGQIAGYVQITARRTAHTVHTLQLYFDPAQRAALAEPLLMLALERLQAYPRQNMLTTARLADADLLDLFARYGFVEYEKTHYLGAKLLN